MLRFTRSMSVLSLAALFPLFLSVADAGELDCSVVPPGAEPIDSHSEARFRRYITNLGTPRNLDAEQQQRFDYLKWVDDCEKAARRATRLGQRRRGIADRLKVNERPKEQPRVKPAFDPNGPGSEPLSPRTEIRMKRYAANDNCQSKGLTEEEYTRCVYFMQQGDELTRSALVRRRISLRRSRPASIKKSVNRKFAPVAARKYSGGDSSGSKIVKREKKAFDLSGAGSAELSGASETRAMRYAERFSCSRASLEEIRARCKYLVQLKINKNKGAIESTRLRIQSRGVSGVIRRGVGSVYRRSIGTTMDLLRMRASQGFRTRPRTIQEAESYRSPVSAEEN